MKVEWVGKGRDFMEANNGETFFQHWGTERRHYLKVETALYDNVRSSRRMGDQNSSSCKLDFLKPRPPEIVHAKSCKAGRHCVP